MIKLSHVSKRFESGEKRIHAVKDVSLQIAPGEVFGIIGFSGAGKSTLVRCINLLERPDAGEVRVGQQVLTDLSQKELRVARKKIGMIFQQFNLFPSRTVFENVAFALNKSGQSKAEITQKVRHLLTLVDIADKELAYPSQLSGGQKQRVAIARALANDPRVLLCDEATSALDPTTTKSILQLLKKLNEQLGLTLVIITHEMAVVKEICDRVAIMDQGDVIEQGDVFSIFANPEHDVTKNFIRSTSNLQKIEELLESNAAVTQIKPGELIVRLWYFTKNVNEPVISNVARLFDIDLNIIFADIEIIRDSPIGGTVASLSGQPENIEKALAYIKSKNVGVEVIKDARIPA